SGQERSFYWRLTGRQNLDFFAGLYGLRRREVRQKINDLCGLLGIEEPDKRFQEYSAGMKQRLALARSLLHNPRILFMDEPTKSLDPWCAEKLRFFIKDSLVRQKKMTVLLATHDLAEAGELCEYAALMEAGAIKACGRTEEVLKGLV
ncbi:MAG: ABC transporter ATP-binding protein, partial [Candidatus Omnitrophica bacterium]|nr:ABC transporter ATP-binding protein [Candidatus Omnitrophota bacterium]